MSQLSLTFSCSIEIQINRSVCFIHTYLSIAVIVVTPNRAVSVFFLAANFVCMHNSQSNEKKKMYRDVVTIKPRVFFAFEMRQIWIQIIVDMATSGKVYLFISALLAPISLPVFIQLFYMIWCNGNDHGCSLK